MEKMETIIYSDFWSKWGSHMCDSQVSWGACFLRSDSCPSSVGTGPGSVATSPPDPLVFCSQSTVAPAVLCGVEFSSQSFPDGEPPFWFLLEPCRLPHFAYWARTFQTSCQSRLDSGRKQAPRKCSTPQQPEASGWGVQAIFRTLCS